MLVLQNKVGTGSYPITIFEEFTENVSDWSISNGTKTVVNADGKSWANQYSLTAESTISAPESWTFYHDKSYEITFFTNNLSYGVNFWNRVIVGPFVIIGYSGGNDYAGVRSSSDTWNTASTNAFAVDVRAATYDWKIRYESLNATQAQVTVFRNSIQQGTKTITKSSLVPGDGSSSSQCYMNTNNDNHRVSTIKVVELAPI